MTVLNAFQRVRFKGKIVTLRKLADDYELDIRSINHCINNLSKTADKAIEMLLERRKAKESGLYGRVTLEQRKTLEEFKRIGDKEDEILKRIEGDHI